MDGWIYFRTQDGRLFRCDPQDGHPAYGRPVGENLPPASVQVEDDWIVVGSVRIPRRDG